MTATTRQGGRARGARRALRGAVVGNVAATLFMCGLSWTVQAVHYPLFARVGDDAFAAYLADHQRRITTLVAVPWAVQGVTAAALVARPPRGVPRWLPALGLGLAGVTVVATTTLAVPQHTRLSARYDEAALASLLAGDRLRVVAWTAHALVALAIAGRAEPEASTDG